MNFLDIEAPRIAAVNGPAGLHSEYILVADIVLATPTTVFEDKPHFELGIVSGDGVHLFWQEAIGAIRGRYFILTRQELDAQTAKEWGARSTKLFRPTRCWPAPTRPRKGIAESTTAPTSYTCIAMSQKLRRIIDEGSPSCSHWRGSTPPMPREQGTT